MRKHSLLKEGMRTFCTSFWTARYAELINREFAGVLNLQEGGAKYLTPAS